MVCYRGSMRPCLLMRRRSRVLLRLHALLVGLRQMADPAPVVAEVLARPEMESLRVEFEGELAASLAAMVRGMLRVQAVPTA